MSCHFPDTLHITPLPQPGRAPSKEDILWNLQAIIRFFLTSFSLSHIYRKTSFPFNFALHCLNRVFFHDRPRVIMAGSTRLRHGNILHDILISKWYTMRAVAFIHWILLAIVKMGLRASLILSYPEIPQDRNSIPTHIRTYAYRKTAAKIGEMIPRLSIELTRCKDAPSVHMESCFIVPSLYGDSWEKTFDCTRFLFSLRNCTRALNSWVRRTGQ